MTDNNEENNQKSNNYEFDNSGFKSKDYEDSDEFDICNDAAFGNHIGSGYRQSDGMRYS